MIGCYLTGALPKPEELIELTRAYDRGKIDEKKLEKTFEDATLKAVNAQESAEFSYITDGMLQWQDLLRPFSENLDGVKAGSLSRWFNNNTFYRKPIVTDEIQRKKNILKEITSTELLTRNLQLKAILPAPYTFAQLSENQFYENNTEFMFKYAQMLNEEIKNLAKLGIKYVQLSDPALVYKPLNTSNSKDKLKAVSDALEAAVAGTSVKTCLQTFFGDFSQILPEALDFPVDHLGIDLYETNLEDLREYSFDKGVALGLVDARSSLIEKADDLIEIAQKCIGSLDLVKNTDIFVCPNCDLEFLPWKRAEEKIKVVGYVAKRLREEFHE